MGVGVQGLETRDEGPGLRVAGLKVCNRGFKVDGLAYMVKRLGFRVQGSVFRV